MSLTTILYNFIRVIVYCLTLG